MGKKAGAALAVLIFGATVWVLFRPIGGPDLITPRLIEFLRPPGPALAVETARVSVAVASFTAGREKAANVALMERITREAVEEHPDLDLIVFGEASLGLYHSESNPHAYQVRIAEPIPGPTSEWFSALARELQIYIAYGFIESAADTLFNTLVVIGPSGQILARHRKMLLHWIDELNGITRAPPNYEVVRVGELRLGLAICADANSAWLNREYQAAKIDALIYSVTSKVPPTARILKSWPYSRMYNAWILAANRSGTEGDQTYPGTVFVSDPTGRVRAIDNVDNGYVYAVIGRFD